VIHYLIRQKFRPENQTVHRKSLNLPKPDLREEPMDVWLRRKHFQPPAPPKKTKLSERKRRLMQLRKLYGIANASEDPLEASEEENEDAFEDLYQWSSQIKM
jgi:hypothetical protein